MSDNFTFVKTNSWHITKQFIFFEQERHWSAFSKNQLHNYTLRGHEQFSIIHSLQPWVTLYVVLTTAGRKASDPIWKKCIRPHFNRRLYGAIMPFLSILIVNLQRLETFPRIRGGFDFLLHLEWKWEPGFAKFSEKENWRRTSLGWIKSFYTHNILYKQFFPKGTKPWAVKSRVSEYQPLA